MATFKTICTESGKSRLPGILPYIDFVNGEPVEVYPSPENPNGNYGKYVTDVVWRGEHYTYREIHDIYINFLNNRPINVDDELRFQELQDVIGICEVDDNTIEGRDVPEYFYYSELAEWREWMNRMYPFCSGGTSSNCSDCCDCLEYERRGGNNMHRWLNQKYPILTTQDASGKDQWNVVFRWLQGDTTMPIYPYKVEDENGIQRLYASFTDMLLLVENSENVGMPTPVAQEWIPGKRYYGPWLSGTTQLGENSVGEPVVYNGEVYFLKSNIDTDNADWNLSSDESKRYVYIHGSDVDTEDASSGVHYWYVGYYDNMYEELLFDKTDNDGNFIHWQKAIDNPTLKELFFYDEPVQTVTTRTASHLDSFKRIKSSIDDSGNTLPGIVPMDENGNIVTTGGNVINLELPYLSGTALNVSLVTDDNGNILEAQGDIITSIVKDEANSEIIFDYVIDGNLTPINENSYTYKDGGVRYRDIYYYRDRVLEDIQIDGVSYTINYIELVSSNNEVLTVNKDYGSATTLNVQTEQTQYESTEYNSIVDYSPIIQQEYLREITTPPIVVDDVDVDRGTAAAFERHLKLGEIKTMEDLENYGNGFFNLQSNNN